MILLEKAFKKAQKRRGVFRLQALLLLTQGYKRQEVSKMARVSLCALAESLVHVTGKDPAYQNFYEKLIERKGKPKSRVALMNKLIRAIFVMLKDKVPFRISETLDQVSKNTEIISPARFLA